MTEIVNIMALDELTTPGDGDNIPIVDISDPIDIWKTKRITVSNLIASLIPKGIFTAVGDILYSTSSATPARLAKPAATSVLQNTSAGAVSWKALTDFLFTPIYKRQGAVGSDWSASGASNITLTSSKIQVGMKVIACTTAAGDLFRGQATVTFPSAFVSSPAVQMTVNNDIGYVLCTLHRAAVSNSQFGITVVSSESLDEVYVSWLAMGE